MIYRIVLVKSEEGYSVSCPTLPGCWSQGDTEQEAIDNIREAIGEYKAAFIDTGFQFDVREIGIAA